MPPQVPLQPINLAANLMARPAMAPFPTSIQAGSSGAAGRPSMNRAKFALLPAANTEGFKFLDPDPNVLTQVHRDYLKKHQLPPALAPKRFQIPGPMESMRRKAISKGWQKPGGHT